jgi:hypothetical protein
LNRTRAQDPSLTKPPPNRHRGSFRRRGCLIAAGIFAVFLVFYLRLFFSDPPAPDDSDLLPPPWPAVAVEENGAWYFERAIEAVDHNEEEALELFRRAASAVGFAPVHDSYHPRPSHSLLRAVDRAAASYYLSDDPESARALFDELRTLLRRYSEQPRTFVDLLRLVKSHRKIAPARLSLALEDQSNISLRRELEALSIPAVVDDWYVRVLRGDYQRVCNWIEIPAFGPWFYRPHRTRTNIATGYRNAIEAANRGEELEGYQVRPEWIELIGWGIGGNYRGDAMAYAMRSNLCVMQSSRTTMDDPILTDTLTRVAIAIRIRHLETSAWPATLDDLVPDLLPEIPVDPFDPAGGPLRWSREERKLWSIGKDEVDGGGADASLSPEEQLRAADPTVLLERTQKQP